MYALLFDCWPEMYPTVLLPCKEKVQSFGAEDAVKTVWRDTDALGQAVA